MLRVTKIINDIRYSSPLMGKKWSGFNTVFGLINSLKDWVLEESVDTSPSTWHQLLVGQDIWCDGPLVYLFL